MTTFEEFREALSAYRLPRILITALELNLFTVIGRRTWTLPQLAKTLGADTRGVSVLCRNLASAGLLKKIDERYRNSPMALRELDANSQTYRGEYLDLLRRHWDDWSKLTDAVKSGQPLDADQPDRDEDDPEYRRQFTWAMHHRSRDMASKVANQLDLRGATSLLDLGGGPGTYALAFLAKNPQLRATVCDRPAALEVAEELAGTVRYGLRLSTLALDFLCESIPGSYDVVWLSNVIHIYSPEENRRLFRNVRKSLTPGGRLIIQDAFTHDRNGLLPAETNLFAVTMLLFTDTGNTYGVQETTQWLMRAGYSRVRLLTVTPGMEDWDGGLLEAVVPGERAKTPRRQRGSPAG